VPRVLFLYGDEDYLRRFYSDSIADILVPDRDDVANRVVMRDGTSPAGVRDECMSLPFFAEAKVVILRDSGLFAGQSGSADDWGFLADMDPSVYLIISERGVDGRNRAAKKIMSFGSAHKLDEQDEATREKWLAKRFRGGGVSIDSQAISRMVEMCDASMYTLASESDKLMAYAGPGGTVTVGDVEELCTASVKSVVFDLTDAMAGGRPADAYRVLNEMRQLREADQKLFIMMAGHISKMLRCKLMREHGLPDNEINGIMKQHPFAFRKMAAQSRRFSVDTLRKMHRFCVESDEAAKSGGADAAAVIEVLIAMAGSGNV